MNEYKLVNRNFNIHFVDSLGDLDLDTELMKLPYIKCILQKFNIKLSMLKLYLNKYHIQLKEIFEYSIGYSGQNYTLVQANGAYKEVYDSVLCTYRVVYYNIYLKEYSHIAVNLRKVCLALLQKKLPFLFSEPFVVNKQNKYKYISCIYRDSINLENIDDMLISDLVSKLDGNYTVKEFRKILNTKGFFIKETPMPLIKLYDIDSNLNLTIYFDTNSKINESDEYLMIDVYDLIKKNKEKILNSTRAVYNNTKRNWDDIKQIDLINKNNLRFKKLLEYLNN